METTRKQIPYASLIRDAIGALILLTAGLAIGLTVNQFRDKPLSLIYQSKEARMQEAVAHLEPAAPPPPIAAKHTTLPEAMTLEEIQEYLKQKSGLIFDARPEIFHRLGHIPGARSLPRDDFENVYKTYQSELERDRSQPIVVYCSGSSCEDSTLVQKSLQALGFTNVSVFHGGWDEWQENNLPVEETK